MKTRKVILVVVLVAVASLAYAAGAREGAAAYPARPIEIVVPWAAGGGSDLTARQLAVDIRPYLPQPVAVTNITGAGGAIGHNHVREARPDGYTILFSSVSFLGGYYTGQFDYKWTELEPLANLSEEPVVVVVHGDAPWNTLGDLIRYGRANPGALTWAMTATGNSTHITAEGIRLAAGIDLEYLSYDGGAQVRSALLGRHVDVGTMTAGEAWENYRAGNFKVLAQSLPHRSPQLPDVPTIREEGIDFSFNLWKGLYVPKGTPAEVISILNEAIEQAVQTSAFQRFVETIRADVAYMGAQEYSEFIAAEDVALQSLMEQMGLVEVAQR